MQGDQAKVVAWLKTWFSKKARIGAIPNVEAIDYLGERLLDSVSVIELVAALEEEYEVLFLQEHLEDPRFRTMVGLAQIVGELHASRG